VITTTGGFSKAHRERSYISRHTPHLTCDDILPLQTFILAGYETTSVALTYAIFGVASYPEVERKLLAEVDAFW